ncbi:MULTISPECIES: amidohydrolase family protein [unclassified Sphingomonas]|uniref:amidohydrolase family protein n=1 Tax=unclassified Sphingomonas TaxID=196159 RepID=UPI0025F61E28|nr:MULTISPECIES: amidohydrolase family protein [unclassified Sphingomonas]
MIRTLVAMLMALLVAAASPAPGDMVLIRGARVFDGSGAAAFGADVLVRGERIAAIGAHIARPRGARLVEARGMTLMPGLHDLHTHMRAPGFPAADDLGKAYAAYLLAGVTSANDYSLSGEMLAPIRAMTGDGSVPAPHLSLAVRLGVPGGHGTEFGWGSAFTLQAATPRAAHVAMRTALSYHPDVIKVFADGWRYGRSPDLGDMNTPTLAAIVRDAHAAGIPVITHTVTLAGAKIAAAAGVDAVGHGVGDAIVDDALIAAMRASGTAYIPSLAAYEPQEDRTFAAAEWQALRPPERAGEAPRLATAPEPVPALESRRWTIMQANVARLRDAGIPIGVGTDAGVGGVYHGWSTVREVRLLGRSGLSPRQALAAATAVSARIMRRADAGRIAIGQRADLILVDGRPDVRLDDLHKVVRVFLSGREVALPPLRRLIDGDAPSPLPAVRMTGPIDTGVRGDGRTDLATLPVDSTEPGIDHSHLDIVRPDDSGARRLFAVARLGAASRPYAQLVVPLTRGAILRADARGFTGVAFRARGMGRYRLTLDSYGLASPFRASFAAGADEAEVRLPFAAFASGDGSARLDVTALRALVFRLEGEPGGRAWLELGELRFYR